MTPTSENLLDPPQTFLTLNRVEPQLHDYYFAIGEEAGEHTGEFLAIPTASIAMVRATAVYLEMTLGAVCLHEAVTELDCDTIEKTHKAPDYFVERVRSRCGLDIIRVATEFREVFQHVFEQAIAAARAFPVRLTTKSIVRAVKSILAACPIRDLEALATQVGSAHFAHRMRIAYDDLRAFTLRNDPTEETLLRFIGTSYAEGRLDVNESAFILQRHPVDVVALFEDRGYARQIEMAGISKGEESQILAQMRADRIARSGAPAFSAEHASRDVVSSERIEGVDARRWIPREEQ